jgi:hypothetical protein
MLDQFHHVFIHQLLQHDHIYRLVTLTMVVRFGGSTSKRLYLVYHHGN